ncbi:Adho123-like protein [Cryptophlebia peltastica nucleopolyhedrovirus]|uniref:Adho123-like protein n=1 Tax=Cryptophlebia peltastica nucleopolyhedrovirus TaxID=2304025 RepID=A0A346RNZ2_9ABAC|nr:Adho123-like protein [Cryptophlebia peltastica nucleopolyhedrovirus]AXS67789.1 Adho123-like protein [Cryptophlebia peltastica nucleopolyhedrovirus]
MTITQIFFIISIFISTTYSENSSDDFINVTVGSEQDELDKILDIIVDELTDIQKNEVNDVNYTKIVLILLVLISVLLIKIKFYKYSMCCKRKKSNEKEQLETIQINELNYNFNKMTNIPESLSLKHNKSI